MNFAIVINVYIDVNETHPNPFDHPTSLIRFENENTFMTTLESIRKLKTETTDSLRIYTVASATQQSSEFDELIREKISECFKDFPYNWLLFTNSDIRLLREKTGSAFLSEKGYPELRNVGFILPSIMGEDIIIQIDDDELLRPEYIVKLKEVLAEHPDKYLFTAPYEKNGTVRIKTEDPLKSWKKFSPMDRDMVRFYVESDKAKESLFGFGGNMALRREFAETVHYPLNIPRGEDFSMLLASRLVYENGNALAGIEKENKIFRSFFLPFEEMTIIHRPPSEAKKDFLNYFENNMNRFIMEWGIFIKQKGLTISKMNELSYYIKEMIGYEDFKEYIRPVFDELYEQYPSDQLDEMKSRLFSLIDNVAESDRWEEYKAEQKQYIESMKRIKTEEFKAQVLEYGSRTAVASGD
ncbi:MULTISPECIES: hypothetical protein [unclassified Oceanispirochaeta]|uniref:hypothetical protein n=1 Tax=unclassified Oceanispirochaeta TaxID=2635722 RepID=UPI000E090025|nr:MULTISPECIES: hypothetical protein [unclassified Oceanispirochaeta]MBF9017531.1 hypothetical protein [Oceanispirochaeta sp. M2]NPD74103.1 hypothetical protein [Oceanispirochaeta sp. M1]RDG30025.1 hypothetical protein DV872_18560 [Oceanispirochaeta sp. M1]